MNVVVIDYGAGNVFSVVMALKRLGYEAVVSRNAIVISGADKVIFPGVGQASEAMKQLKATGLDQLIPKLKMPVLGICLGMQLMCRMTEEENTAALRILPLDVKRFVGDYKVPHMGWNTIYDLKSPLFEGIEPDERMYFVHSYYVPIGGSCIAKCDYNGEFAAAIHVNNFYGCQFHPEKSSDIGEKVLSNFMKM